MQLKHPDTLLIASTSILYLLVSTGIWLWLGPAALVPCLTLLLVVVLGLQLHLHRVREQQDASQLRQIQALVSLHQLIPFKSVSPWMTGWAATPEFAATMYDIVRERKPRNVLELGSGASSVIVAAALNQNGEGHLVSIDQDADYAAQTRSLLERHGLSHRAEVYHAPLVQTELEDTRWIWYDTSRFPADALFDMLIIDGPHRELQKMARYPALPLLMDRLTANAVIVLDDASRKDEKRAVERWQSRFDGLNVRYLDSKKGTAVLSRSSEDEREVRRTAAVNV